VFEGDTLFQVDNPFLYCNITYMRLSSTLEPIWANTFGYLHDPESHFIPVAVDADDQVYSGWEVLNTIEVAGTSVAGDFNAFAGALISMDGDGNPLWLRELSSNTAMRFTYLFSDHENDRTWLTVFTGSSSTIGDEVIVPDVNGSPIIAAVDADGAFSSALALTGLPAGSKGLSIGKGLDNQYFLGGQLNNGTDYSMNCIDYAGNKGLFVASFLDIPASPPTPSIVENGDGTLTATPVFTGNIQWFFNGEMIEGANAQSLSTDESGSYSVQYSYDFGCDASSGSEVVDIIVVGINDATSEPFVVYPNPTDGILNVETNNVGAYSIRIIDLGGKIVYSGETIIGKHYLDARNLNSGVYFIKMISEDKSMIGRVIIK
jgi:hypothetical protein